MRRNCCHHILTIGWNAVVPNGVGDLLAKTARELFYCEQRVSMPQILDRLADDYFIRGDSQAAVGSVALCGLDVNECQRGRSVLIEVNEVCDLGRAVIAGEPACSWELQPAQLV